MKIEELKDKDKEKFDEALKEGKIPSKRISEVTGGDTFHTSNGRQCFKLDAANLQPNGAMVLCAELASGAAFWMEPTMLVNVVPYEAVMMDPEADKKEKEKAGHSHTAHSKG
jgi:hypothetical protein